MGVVLSCQSTNTIILSNQSQLKVPTAVAIGKLEEIFKSLNEILSDEGFDGKLQHGLTAAYPNYKEVLRRRQRDLREDCAIVLAGDTSSGKTALINKIIRQKVFVSSAVASTAIICRIKHSQDYKMVAHKPNKQKYEIPITSLDELKENAKKYITLDGHEDVSFVEVSLPVPVLKNESNVVLVDTPGIGESKKLDEVLMQFMPNAMFIIFVIDASHAGGLQSNGLMALLEKILEDKENIPFFDPRNAIFFTNKWDNITDNGDDVQKTWESIKKKLEIGWKGYKNEHVFRCCLNPGSGLDKRKRAVFDKEFERFEKTIKQVISGNEYKQLQIHFSFLDEFTRVVETGIRSKIKQVELSSEEKETSIQEQIEKMVELEKRLEEGKKELENVKKETISNLIEALTDYIKSRDGKMQILNPAGCIRIEDVSYGCLENEVPERFQSGLEKWVESGEAKYIIGCAEKKLKAFIEVLDMKIKSLQSSITGMNYNKTLSDVAYGMGLLLFIPLTVFGGFLFGAAAVGILSVVGWFKGKEGHREKVDEIYMKCAKEVTKSKLNECFQESFGKTFQKIIVEIVENQIPKQIANLRNCIENLKNDSYEIKKKEDSLSALNEKMTIIRSRVDHFQEYVL